jgi:hypothetical protein
MDRLKLFLLKKIMSSESSYYTWKVSLIFILNISRPTIKLKKIVHDKEIDADRSMINTNVIFMNIHIIGAYIIEIYLVKFLIVQLNA